MGFKIILLGVALLLFGYWIKWSLYWDRKNASKHKGSLETRMAAFDQKIKNNESTTFLERFYYKSEKAGGVFVKYVLIISYSSIGVGVIVSLFS